MLPRRAATLSTSEVARVVGTTPQPRTSSSSWRSVATAVTTTTSPAAPTNPDRRSSPSSFRFVPTPTWSVQEDLALHERHDKVDAATFRRLCRRACLSMPDNDDNDDRSSLRQDVGNMMHMMNQVVEALALITTHDDATQQQQQQPNVKTATSDVHSSNNDDKEAANIYDRPRGVTSAPVAVAAPAADNDDKVWLRTLRDNKMTRVGGHYYFEIEVGLASKL